MKVRVVVVVVTDRVVAVDRPRRVCGDSDTCRGCPAMPPYSAFAPDFSTT